MDNVEYVELPLDHPEVVKVFKEYNCHPPENGKIIGAILDGEVIGIQCLHQVWHAGPVWVRPDCRGNGLWRALQARTEAAMEPGTKYYQFSDGRNESQLNWFGLKPLGWTVWMKEKV